MFKLYDCVRSNNKKIALDCLDYGLQNTELLYKNTTKSNSVPKKLRVNFDTVIGDTGVKITLSHTWA